MIVQVTKKKVGSAIVTIGTSTDAPSEDIHFDLFKDLFVMAIPGAAGFGWLAPAGFPPGESELCTVKIIDTETGLDNLAAFGTATVLFDGSGFEFDGGLIEQEITFTNGIASFMIHSIGPDGESAFLRIIDDDTPGSVDSSDILHAAGFVLVSGFPEPPELAYLESIESIYPTLYIPKKCDTLHEIKPVYCRYWHVTKVHRSSSGDGALASLEFEMPAPLYEELYNLEPQMFITAIDLDNPLDSLVLAAVEIPEDSTTLKQVSPNSDQEWHVDEYKDNGNGIIDYCDTVIITRTKPAPAVTLKIHIRKVTTGYKASAVPQPTVYITKLHHILQGHFTDVSINIENDDPTFGGFDFLVAYDASALSFIEATPGQLLEDCGWEYFTYRYGADGNCGDACPSGLLRIIAIAETEDGPNHPTCYGPPDVDPHELVKMNFLVTNDRTFECQYVPIQFFWGDCSDNSISSVDGEILYVSDHVYDFEGTDITDSTFGFPTYLGVQAGCLDGDKNIPLPFINFTNGGVDIICSEDIDARGDINANGVKDEIADAVMFTNYFISGMSAFGDHVEASIAASDVNADGITLSVADLVYLVRVIQGDAQPYPKPNVGRQTASISTLVNHSAMGVTAESPVAIGGGYFVFEYSGYEIGEPHLINGASDMDIKYSSENGVLKVLVYSLEKDIKIPAGTESIFAVPIDGEGSIRLIETQLSDYYGNVLEAKIETQPILPVDYSLHQNYPNPFNAATTIFYELPMTTKVKFEIFNVLGQKVVTLIDAEETAGIHSAVWDGTDESGVTVASGVYLYRLTTSEFTSEKKMVLMK
ncbi:MAG: T9SS type A sorting domain-containing protein [FCB group bacterium]|nr:T9SS type A sorting domain-containing protein [FCB group bacterium]